MVKIIDAQNEAIVLEIDSGIKNKFKWSWLDKTVTLSVKVGQEEREVTEKLRDYIVKVDVAGKAQCIYCSEIINYGSRGFVSLVEHANKKKHRENITIRRSNYSLGSAFRSGNADTSTMLQLNNPTVSESQAALAKPMVPLGDRTAHSEALILGVIAEHSLPLSIAPTILEAARELAKDPKALNHAKLERTTASYKMRFGLSKTFLEKTLKAIRATPFSLNIDESTSKSDKRVLAILTSYYSLELKMVVVEHLASVEVIRVDANSLLLVLVQFFEENDIPWSNCVSILMDSCNVMRGSKGGLETKIRSDYAPHLLDVDGDSCHHIHNSCKTFCKPFNKWAEHLQSDIHNDVKWSPDLRQYLEEICIILGVAFTMPERFINHRWLSCYDAILKNNMMRDPLKVFYYGFLSKGDMALYKEPIKDLLKVNHATLQGVERIGEIWKELSSKKLTPEGMERKGRIATKLIIYSKKTELISNLYLFVLPILKEYVMLFQSSAPLIHVLHDKQEQIFRDFLSCFVKPERIVGLSTKQLKDFELEKDVGQFVSKNSIFVGRQATKVIKSSNRNDEVILDFENSVFLAYKECAKYMQKKLPLDNSLLQSMSALDPSARGHSLTAKLLNTLGEHMAPFLSEENKNGLPLEIQKFQVDLSIRKEEENERVDAWWADVIKSKKYPSLCQIAIASLSCFHGPMVESSFNTMGDIIDIRSTRTKIATYSSMQIVRYGLRARQSSALQMFKKVNVRYNEVDSSLTRNMKNAARCYKKEKADQRKEIMEKIRVVQQKKAEATSSESQKRKHAKAAKLARAAHQRALKRKSSEALALLAVKRNKK